jgi:multiple sugar transport system permease protein
MDFISEFTSSQKQAVNRFSLRRVLQMTRAERREAQWGLIFISPWLIGFAIFYFVPMIASLWFSMLDFTLSNPEAAEFVGLDNWRRMLFEDPNTWISMGVTFLFAAISLPIGMISALFLAVLLNSEDLIGKNLFRTLFYAPTMVPLIAAILIWNQVLNPQTGWVNRGLELLGISAVGADGLRWFDDPRLIYFAYTFIGLWGIGNAILINMSALQGVPTSLYEAAKVDGATWFRRLRSITLPMISPVIFYNLILSMVGLLQYFIVPWVLTGGDGYPQGTTRFYMVYFYKQAFTFQSMGYGAALAWLMFIVGLAITLLLFSTARYWVYYAGEGR